MSDAGTGCCRQHVAVGVVDDTEGGVGGHRRRWTSRRLNVSARKKNREHADTIA